METDEQLRERLCELPQVNHYWAEDKVRPIVLNLMRSLQS